MFMLITMLFIFTANADCIAPDGSSIPVGQAVDFFNSEFRPKGGRCQSLPIMCNADGSLGLDHQNPDVQNMPSTSGIDFTAYKFISCIDELQCEDPRTVGEFIGPGMSVEMFLSTEGPCQKETRTCDGQTGELSGSFRSAYCNEPNFVEEK